MKILFLIPKSLLSFVTGKLMDVRFPQWISQYLIKNFARIYHINLLEVEKPIEDYNSISEFFVRKLKEGVRPLSTSSYVHPADSKMTARGVVHKGQLLQAKGRTYSITDFLATDSLQSWENGYFITYYLCPTDYHRVHSPIDGWVKEVRYLPGELWPVNEWSVSNINCLFSKNERVIVEIESQKGTMAVVFVGATNVGSIRLTFEPELRTNHTHFRSPQRWAYPPKKHSLTKGDELGMFLMGSTVIVVAPPDWKEELSPITQNQTPKKVNVRSF